jgi:hypothetical protein
LTNCAFCSTADEDRLVPYCELGGWWVSPFQQRSALCTHLPGSCVVEGVNRVIPVGVLFRWRQFSWRSLACIGFTTPLDSSTEAGVGGACSVLFVKANAGVEAGCLALNAVQRKGIRVSAGDLVTATPFRPPAHKFQLAMLTLELDFITRSKGKAEQVDAPVISSELCKRFSSQVRRSGPTNLLAACCGGRFHHPPKALASRRFRGSGRGFASSPPADVRGQRARQLSKGPPQLPRNCEFGSLRSRTCPRSGGCSRVFKSVLVRCSPWGRRRHSSTWAPTSS